MFSSGQMTDLLYTEKDLVTSLKDYIRAEENKLERVKRSVNTTPVSQFRGHILQMVYL